MASIRCLRVELEECERRIKRLTSDIGDISRIARETESTNLFRKCRDYIEETVKTRQELEERAHSIKMKIAKMLDDAPKFESSAGGEWHGVSHETVRQAFDALRSGSVSIGAVQTYMHKLLEAILVEDAKRNGLSLEVC